ncbi:hypothetical protein QQF64_034638 [Cirrhinus molitorella]|uniref:Integrase catalytic domain-containing protein n=1 Tax=Cirrhinus molitorella TaxID=172907 RepID=A0ABR3L428_9TELE
MSLRRFIARRGTPAELYSDQGTNFKAAEKELHETFDGLSLELQQLLAKQKIAFHFNPPAAPHFGGAWEREIRSVKSALYTVVGAQSVSEEVLHTVLLEVEAILNTKPLGYTSSNIADLDAITPNILLMGPEQEKMEAMPVDRVTKVHQGTDGRVRSADVRIKGKIYTRPVARLIILPDIPDSKQGNGLRRSAG